jgi:hypothetical protein
VAETSKCATFGEAIDWLNQNRAGEDSHWNYIFTDHPVPDTHQPHSVRMWNCFLDALGYPNTTSDLVSSKATMVDVGADEITTTAVKLSCKAVQ